MTKRVLATVVVACSLLVGWQSAPAGAAAAAPERSAPAPDAAFEAALISCSLTNGVHPNHPTLGAGSRGYDVLELQCRLGIWTEDQSRGCCGYDAAFGSRTRQKVIDVQRWCRSATGRTDIAVDGVVGPITWRMVHAYSCWA
jgi:hypothetical protein